MRQESQLIPPTPTRYIQTSIPIPTPSPTIVPYEWASSKETGNVNPQTMYGLVGAINYKHRSALDFGFGGMRLAVVTGNDLSQTANQRKLRQEMAEALNQNRELIEQLVRIQTRLSREPLKCILESTIVVVEQHIPTQVICGESGSRSRFLVGENDSFIKVAKEDFRLLPSLYVDTKLIKRADTKEVIQLQGITIDRGSIRDITYQWDDINIAIDILKLAKLWGANFVSITFATDFIKPKLNDFKRLIQVAEENGMYIALIPSSKSGEYAVPPIPNDEMIANIAYLAEQLKPYNNVLLDIYNDPHPVTAEGYNDVITYNDAVLETVQAIRETEWNMPIIIPGNFWSLTFKDLDLKRLYELETNLIFRIHDDPWAGDAAELYLPDDENINDSQYDHRNEWMFMLDPQEVPNGAVMIGEFGFPGTSPFINSELDRQWQEKTLQIIDEYSLSFTQFDVIDTYTWLRGTVEPNLDRGKIIKDLLERNPPIQFDK